MANQDTPSSSIPSVENVTRRTVLKGMAGVAGVASFSGFLAALAAARHLPPRAGHPPERQPLAQRLLEAA